MNLQTAPYTEQLPAWPTAGRHILAYQDEDSVIVYQAYKPSIAQWAVDHQELGGPEFGFSRMSWIKPNFLWMMYRSGWGVKPDQEHTLALRLSRTFFDEILRAAVRSSFDPRRFETQERWRRELDSSEVRLQWDPDHDPHGARQERRAIQLGLRGGMLRRLGTTELREVIDLSSFVAEQRQHVEARRLSDLHMPCEAVYRPSDPEVAAALELDSHAG